MKPASSSILSLRSAGCRPPASRALALLLALASLGACANSPHRAMQHDYRQDANLCRAQNPYRGKVPADPTDLDQVVGIDSASYLKCMGKLGYQQDAKTDPLLRAIHRCETQSTRTRAVTATGQKLGTTFDESAYQACMKERGFAAEALVKH